MMSESGVSMKILVTGANGFIGSAVVRELLGNGISVCAVVHNGHCDRLKEHPLLTIVSCSLEEMSTLPKLLESDRFDTFYHFAWAGSAGPARPRGALRRGHLSLRRADPVAGVPLQLHGLQLPAGGGGGVDQGQHAGGRAVHHRRRRALKPRVLPGGPAGGLRRRRPLALLARL